MNTLSEKKRISEEEKSKCVNKVCLEYGKTFHGNLLRVWNTSSEDLEKELCTVGCPVP